MNFKKGKKTAGHFEEAVNNSFEKTGM
jgi:hypothetical protein